jgi:hypothetical protein
MKTETIEKILNFLEEKEGMELPESWFESIEKLELVKELENHPDGTQYRDQNTLDLSITNLTKLPNDLYVEGSLNLIDCPQLTKLPNKLYVGEDLYLKNSNITKLPDNLYVGESLMITGTNIKEIPNKLYVGWNLYIENTPLAKKYTDEEIYKIVASTGGEIRGRILIQ